jgi:hypothetical protein
MLNSQKLRPSHDLARVHGPPGGVAAEGLEQRAMTWLRIGLIWGGFMALILAWWAWWVWRKFRQEEREEMRRHVAGGARPWWGQE